MLNHLSFFFLLAIYLQIKFNYLILVENYKSLKCLQKEKEKKINK